MAVPFPYGTTEYYRYIGRLGGLKTAERLRGNMRAILVEIAGNVAQTARENVIENGLNQDIADAIRVGEVQENGGQYSIEIIVDLGPDSVDNRAPRRAARAYEYGSGIHGPGGGKYPIDPVRYDWLHFPFASNLDQFEGGDWGGRDDEGFMRSGGWPNYALGEDQDEPPESFYLQHVEHPGVAARPYLRPAIEEHRDDMLERLRGAFKNAIIGEAFSRIQVKA